MNVVKTIRTVVGYTALAIGVTVGGVAICAMVVAPVVAPIMQPKQVAIVTPNAGVAAAPLVSSSVNIARLAQDFVRALPSVALPNIDRVRYVDRIPKIVWLLVAGAAALVVLPLIGWQLRRRATAVPPTSIHLAMMATAALPAKLVVGKTSRTPRAVLALAEAGTAPADIARRTGLPLDAVALCLAMSPIGARQLRPPTA